MKAQKMIHGGRALAAALAGAQLFIFEEYDYVASDDTSRFQRLLNANDPKANDFAVRAADASRVLGPTRSL